MQQKGGFCLCIQYVGMCLLMGKLRPLTLSDILATDCLFLLVLDLLVVVLCVFSFIWLLVMWDYLLFVDTFGAGPRPAPVLQG